MSYHTFDLLSFIDLVDRYYFFGLTYTGAAAKAAEPPLNCFVASQLLYVIAFGTGLRPITLTLTIALSF